MENQIITLLNHWDAVPLGGSPWDLLPTNEEVALDAWQERLRDEAEGREYGPSGGHQANEWDDLRDMAEYQQELAMEGFAL